MKAMERMGNEVQASELAGLRVEFGGFVAEVDKDMSLYVYDTSGMWHICYSYGCDAWDVLTYWMLNWHDKTSIAAMENFIKLVVYPVSLRIADIDAGYISDIVDAQASLNERVAGRVSGEEEEDESAILDEIRKKIKAGKP